MLSTLGLFVTVIFAYFRAGPSNGRAGIFCTVTNLGAQLNGALDGAGGAEVASLIPRAYAKWPRRRAVSDAQGVWTFAELHDESKRFARWLADQGVLPGDRVVVRVENSRLDVAMLFGCLLAGAVFVPLSSQTTAYQLRHVVADCTPSLVLGKPLDGPDGVMSVDPIMIWPKLPASCDSDIYRTSDGLAFLLYTSGSTGRPKAVMSPHAAVKFAIDSVQARLRYMAHDVIFCRIPLSFDYGLYQVLLSVAAGAEIFLADSATDTRLLSVIRDVGATVVPIVPTVAAMLIGLYGRQGGETSVRLFTNTGEALPAAGAAKLRECFPRAGFQLMYGITECKRISIMELDGDLARPGSVGRPLDGTEVVVLGDDGERLHAGDVGQFVVRGPHVMAGYWGDEALTAETFDGDTFRTGDYGWMDDDGYLYFVGRRDTMFKRRGVRMSAAEIETVAREIAGVREAVVLPPTSDHDLVLVYTGTVDADALQLELRTKLESAKVPPRCVPIAELPLTPNGKTDRTRVEAMVRAFAS